MKTRNRNWVTLLAAAVLFLVAARGAIAEEAIPGEKRLPKNVVAYMSLKNVNEFKTQWPKTLFGQMLADDSLADLRGDFLKQFEQGSQEVREHIGLGLAELLAIPQGEVTIAGVILPSGGIGGAMLLDFGDQAEALHKLIDKAHESLDAADLSRNEEEVEDTKLILFQHKAGEGNDDARDAGGYFIKDTVLVIGSHPSVLKDVLARWDGKHDHTFSEHESYQYILERCRDQDSEARPQFAWFIDPVGLFQAVASANPELLGPAAAAPGLMPILGFDKFKGFGGTVDMGQGDFDTISRTLVLLERAPQGIGNLFQFDLAAQSPPKWLSTDWTSYMVINWNAGKAYSTVESFTDMFLGPGALANFVQQAADNDEFGNIHLKKDVIDQLSGAIQVATLEGEAGENSAQGSLVAIQIKKASAVRATLAKLAGLGVTKFHEREFQGETLYEIEVPHLGAEEGGEETRVGVAVAEGHLLVATDVRLLERVLRGVGDAEALVDSAAYKRIARRFPSKTAYISFSRQDTQMKSLFSMLKTAPAGLLTGLDHFDFSKLPSADVLKKYLPPTGSYMEHDPKGLKITSFSLRNESE